MQILHVSIIAQKSTLTLYQNSLGVTFLSQLGSLKEVLIITAIVAVTYL